MSRVVSDIIPLRLIPALLLGTVAYFLIGLSSGPDRFIKFILLLLLFSALVGVFCLFFAIIIADVGVATMVGSIVLLFNMLFSGLLINSGKRG